MYNPIMMYNYNFATRNFPKRRVPICKHDTLVNDYTIVKLDVENMTFTLENPSKT